MHLAPPLETESTGPSEVCLGTGGSDADGDEVTELLAELLAEAKRKR
ncbi:hypothetical protein MMRN_51790 [Mycobacterium marinum]|nr:hypothetical protein [Mycobacterium marinum]AXN52184.1 hypothetical protein CCUG20998_04801 [Mycobacterium marinum]EPQ71788.1 hypothetical protein MMEU_3170 [Mycobacterium marinum str. Europe]RFZ22944.1 hypothetical protein DSM44344_03391 [Mycobacterium marinum]RFZ24711.1 hypothetical protein DSM43519_02110 [Mycobacterium marinum]RFZ31206.1 hypothetical protein NCTC2275_03578 [Mycobacterium marinum]